MKLILDEQFNATVILPTAVAIPAGDTSDTVDTEDVISNTDSGVMTLPAGGEEAPAEGEVIGGADGGENLSGDGSGDTGTADGIEGGENLGGDSLGGDGTEGAEGGDGLGGDGTEGIEGGDGLGGDGTEGIEGGDGLGGDGTEGVEGGDGLEGGEAGIDPGMEGGDVTIDPGVGGDMIDGDMGMMDGDMGMMGGDMGMMEGATGVKDPILSSWPFVIGISVLALVVGVGLGVLWAKLKIKKGIDLYED